MIHIYTGPTVRSASPFDGFWTEQNRSNSQLHKSKGLSLDGQKKFALENSSGRIERDVETRNACVGCRQLMIMSGFHCYRWFWLESFLAGR